MFVKTKLNIDFTKFLQADYTQSSSSCIKHQIYELTDIHKQFGEFPESYCFNNTVIHQLWWDKDQIDFDNIGNQLGMEVVTVSTIKQPPGCVIPYHRDTFYQINQKFPNRTDLKVRANIHMENYKLGHFIQYTSLKDKIETFVDWEAGDTLIWDSSVLHLGANAGMENKYTMQISGFFCN